MVMANQAVAQKPVIININSARGQRMVAARQSLQRRYVVARNEIFATKLRALGQSVDDVTRIHGLKVYEEMLNDPDVAAAYWYLIYSTLADEITIGPCVKKEDDPNYALAKEISDFCNHNIKNLRKPFRDTLEEMLESIAFGHKVAEVTYKLEDWNGTGAKLQFDTITVLPHTATAFVVDAYMNLFGLIARRTTSGFRSVTTIINEEDIIEREKFFIITMRGRNGDPRGTSLLRPAWNGYNIKRQIWPEYLLFLMNVAIPAIIGFTEEGASEQAKKNKEGDPVYDNTTGNLIYLSPEEAMTESLSNIRNAMAAAFPYGADVKFIESKSNGEAFEKAHNLTGEEITRAILLQTLANRDGKHQTRASTSTQMTIVDILVQAIKGISVNSIKLDLFRPLIRYNYGDAAARTLMPIVSAGDFERRNWSIDATALAVILPFCTRSQAEALKEQAGVPQSEEGDDEYIGPADGKAQPATAPNSNNPVVDPANPKPEDPAIKDKQAA